MQWRGLLVREPMDILMLDTKQGLEDITSEFHIHLRNLPHWQIGGYTYFVTFRSELGNLSNDCLMIVKHHILFDHKRKYNLLFAVIMPDHVHLLIVPIERSPGKWYNLAEIIKGVKGSSAININKLLNRTGTVWQSEYFDRMIRNEQELFEKWQYMWDNPLKKGLADSASEYSFYVRPEEKDSFILTRAD
ncbi:MAG TPA: transposase [Candidatus Kapabacteria bacterium]|nr:transposase [Candidatus Kapabacteria bacterium]